ncbi:MAG: UPF0236 family protein [Oscillospiraceae bacterium]|nr:UPF0236 family protein [Oscillospiraceae bacterium]
MRPCLSHRVIWEKTEDIWDEVLTELEKRYDLSQTVIYLHGDGANWIRSGLEYLPNAVFVLDPYHKTNISGKASGIWAKSPPKIQGTVVLRLTGRR